MSYFATSAELAPWVGDLPENWRNDWLKWSVNLSTERPTEEETAERPYIANEDIASWTGQLLNENPQPTEADGRKFQRDDVLFNKLRPYLAKVYHAEFDGISSGELLCLRPCETVLPRYLFYVVASKGFVDMVDAETFGSKMPRADWGIVGHQPLPLPPLETQRQIAGFLDEKTARIDALIAKKRALLDHLAEKRQALITRAVTKGLNPAAPMKPSGIDWLGDIPAHWEVKRLRHLLDGGTRNGLYKTKDQFSEDGVPFVQMGEAFRASRFTGQTKDRVLTNNEELEKWGLRLGDFLIARRSLVFEGSGKSVQVGELSEQHLFESSMIRIRPSDGVEFSNFLSFYFQTQVCRAFFLAITKQVTISGIDSQQLKDIPIVVPPPSEAESIAGYCMTTEALIINATTKVQGSMGALTEYRAALITAAVTGRLRLEKI